jgi:hypothetical protein
VVALLTDDKRWLEVAAAGRRFILEHHCVANLDAAIKDGMLLARQQNRAGGRAAE